MPMNIETANRLVELRKDHNLSQEELAAQLGVSRQAVSKWERAESSPDTDNLIALARLYGVSLDGLLLSGGGVQYQAAPQPDPAVAPDSFDYTAYDQMKEERTRRRRAWLKFPYPVFATLCYLVLGFMFNLWHPGWLIFLTVPIYYGMAAAI